MATAQLGTLLRHIRKMASSRETDRQLLDDFAARRDETAFAALVARHGPMVLRVCRRVLNHEQDAEDAFQATFIVLARRTASIRKRDAVAEWLHGVAYRTAMKAKRSAARRRNHESRLPNGRPDFKSGPPTWDDVQAVLDEEIQRLPETFRTAFVLCVLEGKSGPEAAAELGVKEGTVSSRLTRARQRLQQRLARRGIQLSVLLAALSVAESAISASVPTALADLTVRFGLLVAAGKSAAGVIPAHVAALATGVTKAMIVTKLKIATALLIAASFVAVACGFSASDEKPSTPAPTAKPRTAEEKGETVEFRGRVVDPDGKAVTGAKLVFVYASAEKVPEKVWATSAADGRFHFSVAKSIEDVPWSGSVWDYAYVVATAEGHGFGWARLKPEAGDVTLQLVKDDVPIQGRILDLQGKPVAGVTVRIDQQLSIPNKGDLTAWLETLKSKKTNASNLPPDDFTSLWSPAFTVLFPPVTTGEDGRFTLRGIGRERIADLHVEGPTIATQKITVMTRPVEPMRLPGNEETGNKLITYYGAAFDLVATPTRPVAGVVRDKDSGKPLAGVTVRSASIAGVSDVNGLVQTTTDAEGRYRLVGLPKGAGNAVVAETTRPVPAATDRPYLSSLRQVEDTPGFEPVRVDLALKRGVWIEGRLINKATGQGVRGGIEYFVFADNPNATELAKPPGIPSHFSQRDGSFRIVGVVGQGVLAGRANEDKYRMGVGADQIKGKRRDEFFFITQPYFLHPGNHHTLAEVSPAPTDTSIKCDLLLDPGHTLQGIVVGPDGQPLTGARVSGQKAMNYWENKPLKTAEFTMLSFGDDESRLIQVMHEGKRLAGSLVVHGNDKRPVRVQLQPWGTVTGRLVTPDGELLTDVEVAAHGSGKKEDAGRVGFLPASVRPGKDGKFRLDGLVPGLTYNLGVAKGYYGLETAGPPLKGITIKLGETKDLGDIQVKPME